MKKLIFACLMTATLGGSLVSCRSIQTLTFDQLCPSEVNFPKEIRNIAVVNNMAPIPAPQKKVVGKANLEGEGKLTAETVAGSLADSHYFDQVIICDSALRDKHAAYGSVEPLSGDNVNRLIDQLGVDAILSLDCLHIRTQHEKIIYPGYGAVDALEGKLLSVARIYYPQRERAAITMTKVDSVYWELSPDLSEQRIIENASTHFAHALVHRLVPYWETANRLYYDDGSPDMRDAAVSVREHDWAGAEALWKQVFESRKRGKLKMRSAFNIALAEEMQGNVEAAIKWLDKAHEWVQPGNIDADAIKVYASQLNHRKQVMAKLNLQMNRFDNK